MLVKKRVYASKYKIEARSLRMLGLSLGEISTKLVVPKNTIQSWVKNITLTDEQKRQIKQKETLGIMKARVLARLANKRKLENRLNLINKKVYEYKILPFENKNIEKIICAILYICEGSKYPSTRHLGFVNSDPKVIKLFLKLLRGNFCIDETKFRCRIQHRYDQISEHLEEFWSEITQIPLSKFYKSYKDKRTKNRATKKTQYKGVCLVQYFDVNLQLELQAIGEAIVESGGAEGSRTPGL